MGRKVARRNKRATFRLEKSGSPKNRWQKSSSSSMGVSAAGVVLVEFCNWMFVFWELDAPLRVCFLLPIVTVIKNVWIWMRWSY